MSENLGAGIKLTSDWDLEVDTTGDIASVSGIQELEKDISVLSAIRLGEMLGDRIPSAQNRSAYKSIEVLVERLLASDSRVQTVDDVSVRRHSNLDDTIVIDAEISIDTDATYELVIEVDT